MGLQANEESEQYGGTEINDMPSGVQGFTLERNGF